MRPGLSDGISIAAAPASASAFASCERITKDGSTPDFCGSTSTKAPRNRSSGAGSVAEAGDPRSRSGAATSPDVPGTHANEPTRIARSIGATIRPLAGPRVQREARSNSSKRALA